MFFRIAGSGNAMSLLRKPSLNSRGRRLTAPDQPWVDAVTQAALRGLALEAVHHRGNGVGLEGLYFESKFHGFLCKSLFIWTIFLCNTIT
jgi:hypothetical protein